MSVCRRERLFGHYYYIRDGEDVSASASGSDSCDSFTPVKSSPRRNRCANASSAPTDPPSNKSIDNIDDVDLELDNAGLPENQDDVGGGAGVSVVVNSVSPMTGASDNTPGNKSVPWDLIGGLQASCTLQPTTPRILTRQTLPNSPRSKPKRKQNHNNNHNHSPSPHRRRNRGDDTRDHRDTPLNWRDPEGQDSPLARVKTDNTEVGNRSENDRVAQTASIDRGDLSESQLDDGYKGQGHGEEVEGEAVCDMQDTGDVASDNVDVYHTGVDVYHTLCDTGEKDYVV